MSSINRPEQEHLLTACGRRLQVSVRPGDDSRVPLLLINGIGAPLEVLQPIVDALDPALELIRFDVPGVGRSPAPKTPYNLATLSLSLTSVLDQLGHHGPVDVMGFSWGGGLAQHFAVQHKRRCRRLILVATGTGALMIPAHPRVLSKMATPRRHRDYDYAASIAGDIYGGSMRTNPELAAGVLHSVRPLGPKRGYYYQLAAATGWSSLPFLRLIRQPTLVVAGDDDPIIPAVNPKMMARLIPDARLHLYHGGHLAILTEPLELAPVIEEFLVDR